MGPLIPTLQDAVLGELILGELIYDDRLSRWDGPSAALGVPFSLSAHTFADSGAGLQGDEAALEVDRAAFLRLEKGEGELRRQVAEAMTELAEDWRDPDADPLPLTPERVLERVKLESATIAG
ncbi:DUF2262 domain-containing protein [Deinococcus wulumuqiensis]|uniref:DUF2262 domain-containing protein n=1 Tax=Deinococcus wulumuqiensis TaxID=980427 RepID=A0AAV4K523_9DEIO|nr:DUF2262 domain-containing protein [Deinococcus wulumuqiensis]QII20998.1 DUF2262 domain-containing protein [Deinococcus wulumuqiensis R12]GGI79810.1 hypothetical protein GCM10010914_12530 [Deinococcus wulumuqiensis]GGP29007.1 hypothetical protein GCM10008021_06580 [Deinococcus wulumuqiensis]